MVWLMMLLQAEKSKQDGDSTNFALSLCVYMIMIVG